jgi:hypothetical protein
MLSREDPGEFFDTLKLILDKSHIPLDIKDTLPKDHEASDDKVDLAELESKAKNFIHDEF